MNNLKGILGYFNEVGEDKARALTYSYLIAALETEFVDELGDKAVVDNLRKYLNETFDRVNKLLMSIEDELKKNLRFIFIKNNDTSGEIQPVLLPESSGDPMIWAHLNYVLSANLLRSNAVILSQITGIRIEFNKEGALTSVPDIYSAMPGISGTWQHRTPGWSGNQVPPRPTYPGISQPYPQPSFYSSSYGKQPKNTTKNTFSAFNGITPFTTAIAALVQHIAGPYYSFSVEQAPVIVPDDEGVTTVLMASLTMRNLSLSATNQALEVTIIEEYASSTVFSVGYCLTSKRQFPTELSVADKSRNYRISDIHQAARDIVNFFLTGRLP